MTARPTHGGNLAWAAEQTGVAPAAILDFSASINPLGPPASAIASLQAHLSQIQAYPDPDYRALRRAIAQHHDLDPDWILPGNGAAELLTWAARDLAATCAETRWLVPGFADYARALTTFGAAQRGYALALPAADLPDFTQGPLPSRHCGLLLNNPHNPTGKLWSRQHLEPLLAAFALVVVDEAFMDFLPPQAQESLVGLVGQHPNLVILRSLTKFYSLPGLRLGYAIAHPEGLQRWQRWRDPWPVNSLAVAAGLAVLTDRDFQERTWRWLPPARSELYAGLAALPGLQPLRGAANFLLVATTGSSRDLQAALLQQHQILIRDCGSFPELGDRYFRVAVRTSADNQRLLAALAWGAKDPT